MYEYLTKAEALARLNINTNAGVFVTPDGRYCSHDHKDSWCSFCYNQDECPWHVDIEKLEPALVKV
jgi:hypothetical protein